jgi:hypothetical protein
MSDSIPQRFVAAARQRLAECFEKIEHCINQLPQEDLSWRPFEQANSITNIVLHLCGNLRQWVIHAAGDRADVRNRPSEFSDRSVIAGSELIAKLAQTVRECDQVIANLSAANLTAPKRVQGFETNKLDAVFNSVAHFQGHTQEIIYITRVRLRDRYQFKWVPKGKEQGGK